MANWSIFADPQKHRLESEHAVAQGTNQSGCIRPENKYWVQFLFETEAYHRIKFKQKRIGEHAN